MKWPADRAIAFGPAVLICAMLAAALLKLAAHRLAKAIHARLSSDQGATWTEPFILRGNGGSQDIGYPRTVVRPGGHVVAVYAFHNRAGSVRDIKATIWNPGSR